MEEIGKKRAKYNFSGETALVTGAAGGIGRAVSRAFAKQGASVVIADIDLPGATETLNSIEALGGRAAVVRADVTSDSDVRDLIDFVVDRFGRLDFACNNAGVGSGLIPLVELPRDRWDRTLAVDLTGIYQCLKYELRQMLKQGSGAIVNIGSVASLVGSSHMASYVASKHGVAGLTKTAAIEAAKTGIRVNAVAPGVVDAGLTKAVPRDFVDTMVASQPMGRMAQADEIAAAVLWLCSDEASFVQGHTLVADGGTTIM
jgi:NAD(P)-dependent dehydrogenase (short-subunit alcohol dehydrogenase family)